MIPLGCLTGQSSSFVLDPKGVVLVAPFSSVSIMKNGGTTEGVVVLYEEMRNDTCEH